MRAFTRLVTFLVLGLFLSGCGTKPGTGNASPAAIKQYPMHGQITGLDPAQHVATIKHDEIPGFMGAMTMGYSVKDPAEFGKLAVGESFHGTVYVQGDDLWVGDIHKEAAVKP